MLTEGEKITSNITVDLMIYAFLVVSAYVIGSISFADVIGKIKNINIKQVGSKNPGAANVTHSLGFKYGFLVGVLDILKAAIPIFIINNYYTIPNSFLVIFSISFILGHNYSIFLRFKGGKGVSTAMGVVIALTPISCLVSFVVLIIFTLKKQVAPGMLVFFTLIPLLNQILYHNTTYTLISCFILLVLVFRRITYTNNYSKRAIVNKLIYDNEEKTVAKLVF